MKKSNKALPFLIVAALELSAVAFDMQILQWVFKPLIMITLAYYYYVSIGHLNLALSRSLIGAILLSWVGDIALMFQGREIYFIIGLGSFLIAHLCYLVTYRQHMSDLRTTRLSGIQQFRFALPVVLAGTGLITILYPHLGALKIPVVVYAFVLIVMVLQALFRFGRTNQQSFWFVFIGAVFFMISDATIAINKFLTGFDLAGLLIMSTYVLAQFLIIRGLVSHAASHPEH